MAIFLMILMTSLSSFADSTEWEVMGLSNSATEEEVRLRYRRLMLKHHPDRNHGSFEAEERSKEILKAYKKIKSEKSWGKAIPTNVHEATLYSLSYHTTKPSNTSPAGISLYNNFIDWEKDLVNELYTRDLEGAINKYQVIKYLESLNLPVRGLYIAMALNHIRENYHNLFPKELALIWGKELRSAEDFKLLTSINFSKWSDFTQRPEWRGELNLILNSLWNPNSRALLYEFFNTANNKVNSHNFWDFMREDLLYLRAKNAKSCKSFFL